MTSLWQLKRFEARIPLFKSLDCPLALAAAGMNQRFTRYPPVINHNLGWCNWRITSGFRLASHRLWQKYFERPPMHLISEAIKDVEQAMEEGAYGRREREDGLVPGGGGGGGGGGALGVHGMAEKLLTYRWSLKTVKYGRRKCLLGAWHWMCSSHGGNIVLN